MVRFLGPLNPLATVNFGCLRLSSVCSQDMISVSAIVHSPLPDDGYGTVCPYTYVGLTYH